MRRFLLMLSMLMLSLLTFTPAAQSAKEAKKPLVIAIQAEPDSYDLSSTRMIPLAELVGANVTEKLIGVATSGKLIPGLATAWKASPDGKEIAFTLRKGVKFHSGDPLTAKDVEFSFKRALEKIVAFKNYMKFVDRLEVVDDYRIKVHFKQPDAEFLPRFALAYIVSKAYYDRVGEEKFVKQPVGTGPYVFVNWALGESVVLKANDSYWGGAPAVKEVHFVLAKEGATRIAKLQTGEADIVLEIPFPLVNQLEKEGFKIYKIPAHPSPLLLFQNVNPNVPWYNKNVRLACALAIDREAIVKKVLHGIPEHLAALAPWELGYDPQLKPYPYDPARARKLLAEAGYPKGFEMPLYYQVGRTAEMKEVVESLALYLNAVGIKCNVTGLEPVQYMEKVRYTWRQNPKAEYVGIGGILCQQPDPVLALPTGFSSDAPLSVYSNPEFDKLAVQMRSTLDDGKRGKIIKQAVKILHDDVAAVLIAAHKMVYATGKNIQFTPTIKTLYPLMLVKDVKILN